MAKIYTRTGDAGETALLGGPRVRKDDDRVAAYGTVDELSAVLGIVRAELARSEAVAAEIDRFVAEVQHQLFQLGAELATPQPGQHGAHVVQDADVTRLEAAIDRWDAEMAPLREFILPGGCPAAAQLHLARCACRRAERQIVRLAAHAPIRGEVLCYVNRLSDALFVLARAANHSAGVPDTPWRK